MRQQKPVGQSHIILCLGWLLSTVLFTCAALNLTRRHIAAKSSPVRTDLMLYRPARIFNGGPGSLGSSAIWIHSGQDGFNFRSTSTDNLHCRSPSVPDFTRVGFSNT
ncbi:hypothetical protein B0H16DRAFT_1611636 [Mycena metata]|uniref:Uncharacterized protein n=1 Tax=Mycena metata TaxID=1033252 RepID=A0AAD7MHK9_9AGAR|nr:hypothetical protein B0H16DRAFT_1611636 [Mycena metata]